MANPNNALGTNAAYGGRTSVNAFNDVANFWTVGRVSGWGCTASSGLTVQLGGNGESRDVALAQDPSGNKTTVDNISGSPIEVTLDSAPASNSRIDAIVAYIEDSPSSNAKTDNYDVVNLLTVAGTSSSSPIAPDDSAIRTAITADGASGTTCYYVVLATVTLSSGTTDIDNTMITQGAWAQLSSDHIMDDAVKTNNISDSAITTDKIASSAITSDKIDFTTLNFGNYSTLEVDTGFTWIDGSKIYKKSFDIGAIGANRTISHGITDFGGLVKIEGAANTQFGWQPIVKPVIDSTSSLTSYSISIGDVKTTTFLIQKGTGITITACWVTLYYIKSS